MAKAKTKKAEMAADRDPKTLKEPLTTDGDVARRAYALYLERGHEHGRDMDDWLQAEQELRASSVSA